MLIFLDSNIICADYKMKRPSFEVAQKVGTIDWDKLLLMRSVISTERILKRRQQKQEKQFWS